MSARTCRLLLVDDEPAEFWIAQELAAIPPRILAGCKLAIQLTNTAYFAAQALREKEHPPWDIIIADAFMPAPSRNPNLPPEHTAREVVRHDGARKFTLFEYCYTWNSQNPAIAHGGMEIARAIRDLRRQGRDLGDLKLLLVSRRLLGWDKEQVHDYQTKEGSWFKYYDKPERSHRAELAVFFRALIHAIDEQDSGKFEVDNSGEILTPVCLSKAMQSILVEARELGEDPKVHDVLITGEIGTGKRLVAQQIHRFRMAKARKAGAFVDLDCSNMPDEVLEQQLAAKGEVAANGTLFLRHVDLLRSWQQGALDSFLGDRLSSLGGAKFGELIILSSRRPLDEMAGRELFSRALLDRLAFRIAIPPLRERRDDVVGLAAIAVDGRRVNEEARKWLLNNRWTGNARLLMTTLRRAAHYCQSEELTAEALVRAAADVDPRLQSPQRPARRGEKPQRFLVLYSALVKELGRVTELRQSSRPTIKSLRADFSDWRLWDVYQGLSYSDERQRKELLVEPFDVKSYARLLARVSAGIGESTAKQYIRKPGRYPRER